MPKTTRSRNLDLIRWLNFGHENTAKKLVSITNANYLSKMATGDMEISDRKARSIERATELPLGWLDRDNIAMLKMTPLECQIHQLVSQLSQEKQSALLALLTPEGQ